MFEGWISNSFLVKQGVDGEASDKFAAIKMREFLFEKLENGVGHFKLNTRISLDFSQFLSIVNGLKVMVRVKRRLNHVYIYTHIIINCQIIN